MTYGGVAGVYGCASQNGQQHHLSMVRALVCVPGKDEQKKRLRLELMRWHPDKFHSRFRMRLVAKDTERISERVESQTKALNALAARNKTS